MILTLSDHRVIEYIIPIMFCVVSITCSIISILTYHKYKKLRINAGKVVFVLVVLEFILSCFFFASVFYETTNQEATFCQIVGGFTNFFIIEYYLFNFALCHNLISCLFFDKNVREQRFHIKFIKLIFVLYHFIILMKI